MILVQNWPKTSTCQLFFSKMREIFRLHRIWVSEDLPTASKHCLRFRKTSEDHQRFPMTSEDFPTASDDNRTCRKIFDDLKTWPATISKGFQSWALLKSSKDVLTTSRTSKRIEFLFNQFLSNYTCYCQLGVRNKSECMRSQF